MDLKEAIERAKARDAHNIDDAIDERWRELTDDGRLDSRVRDMEKTFDDLLYTVQARYGTSGDILEAIRGAKARAVAQLKARIVCSPLRPMGLRIHDCAESGCEPEPPPKPDAA